MLEQLIAPLLAGKSLCIYALSMLHSMPEDVGLVSWLEVNTNISAASA